MMLSPPFAEDDSSASKVLNNDDLLGEILRRLHCTTCFVSAALTSRGWLGNASEEATIHSFRSRQSPQLLGIYILSDGFLNPEFVPLPDASRSELATALHHGNFRFDDMDTFDLSIWDCRNDRVLCGLSKPFNAVFVPIVRKPLRSSREDMDVLPPQLPTTWLIYPHAMLLPEDDDDDSSCYRIDIKNQDKIVCAQVFALQANSSTLHCFASANLTRPPKKILKMTLLMGGKIYILTTGGYILALDLSSHRFFVIDLPEGVEFVDPGNLAFCRGDGSALYLIHVKEDKLTVWLQRMNDGHDDAGSSAGEWVRKDTILLHETCGHLVEDGREPAEEYEEEEVEEEEVEEEEGVVSVVGVGDNAEFVFLEFQETCIVVYMHLKSREVKVVYRRHRDDDFAIRVLPFMMVWPLVLPSKNKMQMKVEDCIKE